jgi:hypothetical protein
LRETGRASSATGYLPTEEMVGSVFVWGPGEMKWRLPPKRGGALTQTAKEIIALLVATLVLVGACVAYAANTYPAHYAANKGGDHPGKDDSLLAEGFDGLVGRWLGDAEEPGEPPD